MSIINGYILRRLSVFDLENIQLCLNSVIESLPNKELFVFPSIFYIKKIIYKYGISVGIFDKDILIGFSSIIFPKETTYNLGQYLHYQKDKMNSVAQLEHICLRKEYRGKGLSKALVELLIQFIPPEYTLFLSTISPKNMPSLSLAFYIQQKIIALKRIYGFDRYIMCRCSNKYCMSLDRKLKLLAWNDKQSIIQALESGYCGIGFNDTKTHIVFRKE